MEKSYTHITVVLDRSGSMESVRDDTIGGMNTFIDGQKALPGRATFSLVQFDSQDPYEVVRAFMPMAEVPPLDREVYVPRSGTPLLDALGRAINDVESSTGGLLEEERPEKVVVAVVTDGQENSSREFKKAEIEKMIAAKRSEGWEFMFLSADMAAIDDAVRMGFERSMTVPFEKSSEGVLYCMEALSARVCERRSAPGKRR
ncbi:vWA domain-containing protein [Chlorobium sp. N1]|uniref:vWA domain-containing protein n=1 Tax=Chlorobium sp. N1 TaxID=2491138 RepID=UPI00103BDA43|nr:vWA domain-containing protein [Chlorobium sp. N1]TCD46836.1 VWA domain-containing protein [Chlorobium sp. N1]